MSRRFKSQKEPGLETYPSHVIPPLLHPEPAEHNFTPTGSLGAGGKPLAGRQPLVDARGQQISIVFGGDNSMEEGCPPRETELHQLQQQGKKTGAVTTENVVVGKA